MIKPLIDVLLYFVQEMYDKVVSKDSLVLQYCHDRYKIQELCDKAVDDFLPALEFVPDWFVTSKMIKKLHIALYADDDILFFDEDFGNVTFCCN